MCCYSLYVQSKEVLPDPELVRKLNWLQSSKLSPNNDLSGCPSSMELTYITDFFLALAVCNSVVVSSPSQPRHTVTIILTAESEVSTGDQMGFKW